MESECSTSVSAASDAVLGEREHALSARREAAASERARAAATDEVERLSAELVQLKRERHAMEEGATVERQKAVRALAALHEELSVAASRDAAGVAALEARHALELQRESALRQSAEERSPTRHSQSCSSEH